MPSLLTVFLSIPFNKLPWSSLFEFLLESNVDPKIGDLMLSSLSEKK
jgi:hypothetical protein